MMMDVVALGALAVDYYAVVPKLPKEDEKTTATEYKIMPGGGSGERIDPDGKVGFEIGLDR